MPTSGTRADEPEIPLGCDKSPPVREIRSSTATSSSSRTGYYFIKVREKLNQHIQFIII